MDNVAKLENFKSEKEKGSVSPTPKKNDKRFKRYC